MATKTILLVCLSCATTPPVAAPATADGSARPVAPAPTPVYRDACTDDSQCPEHTHCLAPEQAQPMCGERMRDHPEQIGNQLHDECGRRWDVCGDGGSCKQGKRCRGGICLSGRECLPIPAALP